MCILIGFVDYYLMILLTAPPVIYLIPWHESLQATFNTIFHHLFLTFGDCRQKGTLGEYLILFLTLVPFQSELFL